MNPNRFPLFSPTLLAPSQLTYPIHLPVESYYYPYASPGGFNKNWGPTEQQELLKNAIQIMGLQSSTIETTQFASGSTGNHGHPCRWFTSGVPCADCFSTFDELMDHLGRVHDVQGPAGRKICCKWWTHRGECNNEYRRDAFRRHIGTHLGHSVLCTECSKSFSRNDSMRAHMKKQHGKQ